MNVLQVNKLFYPWIGGVEQVVYDLATGLKPYIHQSSVLASHHDRRWRTVCESIAGVDVYRVASLGMVASMPLSPTFPLWLRKLAKDADILHFHHPFPVGDTSYLLTALQTPAVMTWHSEIVRQQRLLEVYRPFLRVFLQRVHKVLVTSPQLLHNSEMLQPFHEKCEIVPLGIDVDKHKLGRHQHQQVADLQVRFQEMPIVLFVGRLVYYKGIEYLIRAMQLVPEALLFVVGTGLLEDACRALVSELGLEERVIFWGKVSDEQLSVLYHACDVFVLPSVEQSEAFGLVQLEAMSCAKPVISSDLPTGVTFVNQHGETGLVVPPKDAAALAGALNELLQDSGLRRKLGQQALRRVRAKFSRDRMVQQVAEIYHSM